MAQTKPNKPDIVQSFDFYVDREYYKIVGGFFFSSSQKVRIDNLKNWNEWRIGCEQMPDKIYVNGEEFLLTPTNQQKV